MTSVAQAGERIEELLTALERSGATILRATATVQRSNRRHQENGKQQVFHRGVHLLRVPGRGVGQKLYAFTMTFELHVARAAQPRETRFSPARTASARHAPPMRTAVNADPRVRCPRREVAT